MKTTRDFDIKSQSLLNEVKFPTNSEFIVRLKVAVAIPFKWGQVSYKNFKELNMTPEESQSLLNEVKFPTDCIKYSISIA